MAVEANLYDPITGAGLLYYTVENPNGVSGYGVSENGELGEISPIGIRTYDEELGFDTASYIHYIALRYKDGSKYVLIDNDGFIDNSMYALGTGLTERYFTVQLFNRIVDINSLSDIILDDKVIQVD